MDQVDLNNKRVLIREDLNVPMHDGSITDDTRIQSALPTIRQAVAANARVMLLSHLGRPKEGEYDEAFSLAAVAKALSKELGQEVLLVKDWLGGVEVEPGRVVLCENVRFNAGEKANDAVLAKKMAALCDVFIIDAFATAHRAHASTVGVIEASNTACAGPLLSSELSALGKALKEPKHPLVAIVGGSKVSTKIQALTNLLDKVDTLIVGGGIANTFLKAKGFSVGQSLYESDWVESAATLLKVAEEKGVAIPLPTDVRVAKSFSEDAEASVVSVDAVGSDQMILDVGPATAATYAPMMQKAETIVWNGPVGVFEFAAFSEGTKALGEAIADSHAYSIAGGGDTLAALAKFKLTAKISYRSTGGGAFLELLEGKELPVIRALEEKAKDNEHNQ